MPGIIIVYVLAWFSTVQTIQSTVYSIYLNANEKLAEQKAITQIKHLQKNWKLFEQINIKSKVWRASLSANENT